MCMCTSSLNFKDFEKRNVSVLLLATLLLVKSVWCTTSSYKNDLIIAFITAILNAKSKVQISLKPIIYLLKENQFQFNSLDNRFVAEKFISLYFSSILKVLSNYRHKNINSCATLKSPSSTNLRWSGSYNLWKFLFVYSV